MARIKDIPNFYERLHALETPEITTDEEGIQTVGQYNLKNIPKDHEVLVSLRKEMGIKLRDTHIVHVDSDDIDWEFVERCMKVQNLRRVEVCDALGFVSSTWGRKIRNSTFTVKEIRSLEYVLKLTKGSLLPLTKEEEYYVRRMSVESR